MGVSLRRKWEERLWWNAYLYELVAHTVEAIADSLRIRRTGPGLPTLMEFGTSRYFASSASRIFLKLAEISMAFNRSASV